MIKVEMEFYSADYCPDDIIEEKGFPEEMLEECFLVCVAGATIPAVARWDAAKREFYPIENGYLFKDCIKWWAFMPFINNKSSD